jgi:catechol 2,3-dioxygenase-like lactoylglutathione lyase family enzyme
VPLHALEHLLVLTDDPDGSRDFYRDALGLQPGARPALPFPGHWMYADDTPCVHLADRGAYAKHAQTLGLLVPAASGPGAIDHIAFRATGYVAIVARLERLGVPTVRNTVEGAGIRQLFINDPNGVRIEVNVLPDHAS